MANWLLDYIEMTEYIPSELREQLTSIRELDLQVHNAMDELERDIKQFFSRINTLSPKERQDQYDAFLRKCDVATRAASDKVKVADKLHDLVEKSMRLLDQGLEKLKEDLLEGDKAYIVEDLERKSQEEDEQARLEQETILQRSKQLQQQQIQVHKDHHQQQLKIHSKSQNHNKLNSNESNSKFVNSHDHEHPNNHHRHSISSHNNIHNHPHHHHHRNRNNSTGATNNAQPGRQKKRERKRINSTMSIFNRNSRTDDDSFSNQLFLSAPIISSNYLSGVNNNNNNSSDSSSLNDVIMGNNLSSLTATTTTTTATTTPYMKGMMAGNRNMTGVNDKSNGKIDPLAGAKQPVLTAIDAAHAVSPNATNSDKLVLFTSTANGDNHDHNPIHNNISNKQNNQPITANNLFNTNQHNNLYQNHATALSHQLLSTVGLNSGDSSSNITTAITKNHDNGRINHIDHHLQQRIASGSFNPVATTATPMPLSSRHDPIIMAASQAINATQNMTPGRRTSSLKASYAAVNSGRLHTNTPPQNHHNHHHHHHHQQQQQQLFDQSSATPIHEVYCKCRSHIQGSNMIACDNTKCKIEWFHYECVGITTPPEGEWYCEDCRASVGILQKNSTSKQAKLEGVNVA